MTTNNQDFRVVTRLFHPIHQEIPLGEDTYVWKGAATKAIVEARFVTSDLPNRYSRRRTREC